MEQVRSGLTPEQREHIIANFERVADTSISNINKLNKEWEALYSFVPVGVSSTEQKRVDRYYDFNDYYSDYDDEEVTFKDETEEVEFVDEKEPITKPEKTTKEIRLDVETEKDIELLFSCGDKSNKEDKRLMDFAGMLVLVATRGLILKKIYEKKPKTRTDLNLRQNFLSDASTTVLANLPKYRSEFRMTTFVGNYIQSVLGVAAAEDVFGISTPLYERNISMTIRKAINTLTDEGYTNITAVDIYNNIRAREDLKSSTKELYSLTLISSHLRAMTEWKGVSSLDTDDMLEVSAGDTGVADAGIESMETVEWVNMVINQMHPVAQYIQKVKLEYLRTHSDDNFMSMHELVETVKKEFPTIGDTDVKRFDAEATNLMHTLWLDREYQDNLSLSEFSLEEMDQDQELLMDALEEEEDFYDFFD